MSHIFVGVAYLVITLAYQENIRGDNLHILSELAYKVITPMYLTITVVISRIAFENSRITE